MGEGPRDAVGVVLGEFPGRDDADRGRPFVGPTGQQLDESFITAKLPRAHLFLGYAAACPLRIGTTEGEMRRAVDACRPAMLRQLRRLTQEGVPVLLMGKWAVYSVLGDVRHWAQRQGFLQEGDLKTMRRAVKAFEKRLLKEAKAKKNEDYPEEVEEEEA